MSKSTGAIAPVAPVLTPPLMCVLEPRAMSRSLGYEAYAQIDIITCQPHEECRPMMSGEVNIGKFGLG